MALSSKEQFRMGFLLRCAEEGLGQGEIVERVKFAATGPVLNALRMWAAAPFQLSALGLGGAALTGSAGGYALAKATEDEIDPEDAKRQELIATYQQQADKARRAMSRQRYRGQAPSAPKLFQ